MAAPVSVIRMSALLLKRQMSGATEADVSAELSAWAERVALVEEQVAALALGVHALRDWELSTDDEGITRGNLVARCTALMRVAFELRGIHIHVGEGLSPVEGERRFPAGAALRYMFLGALGYLHDSAPNIGEIRVEAEGEDALRFSALPGKSTPADPLADAHRAPRALAIDAIALQSLAEGLGYALSVEPDAVCFALGTALAPA